MITTPFVILIAVVAALVGAFVNEYRTQIARALFWSFHLWIIGVLIIFRNKAVLAALAAAKHQKEQRS